MVIGVGEGVDRLDAVDLRRRMEATLAHYDGLGQHLLVEPLATFSIDTERPNIWDANFARSARASTPDEIDELLARIEQVYAGLDHRRVLCDVDTPEAIEARLALAGWTLDTMLQHLLIGELPEAGDPLPGLTIDPVVDDDDWAEMTRITRLDHLEEAVKEHRDPWPEALTRDMVGHKRRKAPDMQPWLARIDGQAVGMFSSMPGVDGVGLVEDLAVEPAARGHGIARALIHHCTADARARGAGPVIIGSLIHDWPKQFYARLGFRPMYVERTWDLEVASTASAHV